MCSGLFYLCATFLTDKTQIPPVDTLLPGLHWRVVNYDSKQDLVEALRGTHTLLSFIQLLADPRNQSQRNLIDAAVAAGVKRFAPSEYGR